ncbi:hypothetical protein B5X24_HaOG209432 [Helicoverpa armigera]|uniref:Uncharacterized protein n=1 Tax=Helicoverpa armigera TaxID=29058 RepID=A0A2W1BIN7_HELAM|nr:hypothetical protein B5X24_HaOG209432 [Helicoverpa armigera]
MKGFVLFLVAVLLAYTYAAPQGATNYAPITASGGSAASGVFSVHGGFSVGGGKKSCGLQQQILSALWNVC